MERIFVSKQVNRELLGMKWNVLGETRRVSDRTIDAALKGVTQSSLARAIRAVAMQRGGAVRPGYVPDCTSDFNPDTQIWEFIFRGKVVLTLDVLEKEAKISKLGTEGALCYHKVNTIAELVQVQMIAEELAEDPNF